jgi:hypothetical protein
MTNRIDRLKAKFPLGNDVRVANVDPKNLGGADWPGIVDSMHQFFCGDKLRILGYERHGERLAVRLNTADFGAPANYLFDTDWLSTLPDNYRMPIQVVRQARRGARGAMISRNFVQKVQENLAAKRSKRTERLVLEKLSRVGKQEADVVLEEEPSLVEDTAPAPTNDLSWGAVFSAAAVTALGIAIKDGAKNKKATTKRLTDTEEKLEEVAVAAEVFK